MTIHNYIGWKEYGIDSLQEQRRMSTFMQYAMLASGEALEDAGWRPKTDHQREMTVSHGSLIVRCDDSAQLCIRAYV